ncbi:MAG: hypothetical protein B5M53_06395 [Candidatus Cloacimonas sp. 4484_209]|nr:MAG: hypothetical protein B5M53_06395 [Candidatus Cloacimonas sp. 4484_209]
MDILFIRPKIPKESKTLRKKLFEVFHPSLTFEQISSITPKHCNIDFIDERFKKIDFDWDGDLVAITSLTVEAKRAYEIADKFKSRGKRVVLGGYHPSALPEEAKQHADAVVIGEAEETWPQLLRDFENGKLKPFYRCLKPPDMKSLPIPDRRLHRGVRFSAAVQGSRGCPVRCEFCAISNTNYGHIFRSRRIEDIIAEIKTLKEKYIFFLDPNITANPSYAKSLFKEMIGLNKKFKCFGNIHVLERDEELLKLAAEAGCSLWFVGFETFSQEALDRLGKRNVVNRYKTAVRKIHDYGMEVFASFIFGFDEDRKNVFETTLEKINEIEVDIVSFSILTPYPGTSLFLRLEKEKRILTRDWSKYDEDHVVFQPKNMSPYELLFGTEYVRKEACSFNGTLRRLLKAKRMEVIFKIGRRPFLYL